MGFWDGLSRLLTRGTPWFTFTASTKSLPPEKNMDNFMKSYTYWTYACARLIAQAVAEVPLKLYVKQKDGSELEVTTQHPLMDMLTKVNPWMTEYELREMTILHLELAGEAWWALEKSSIGLPAEIWPLMPHYVEVIPSQKNFMDGINYVVPGGDTTVYKSDEVIQFKYSHPTSLYRGWSPTKSAALPIDIHQYAQEWVRNFFFNDATPGGVLSTDQPLTEPQALFLQNKWTEAHKGRAKSHRIAIMGMGTKFQTIDRSLSELAMTDQQKQLRDDILAIYGVPKAVLGIVEDVNRANAEASEYVFAKRVVLPRLRRMEQRLNEFLVAPHFDERLCVRFADPVPDNRDLNLREVEVGVGRGIMTIDEARKLVGLDEIDGGRGNIFTFPSNVLIIPADRLGDDVQGQGEPTPSSEKPPPGGSPAADNTQDDTQTGDEGATTTSGSDSGSGGTKAHPTNHPRQETPHGATKDASTDESEAEVRWQAWVRMTGPQERKFASALKRFFQRQQNEVMRRLKEIMGDKALTRQLISVDSFLWDSDEAREIMERFLGPILNGIVFISGERAIAELGLSIAFDVEHPAVKTGLREQTSKIVGLVDDTTRQQLRDTLTEGLAQGESIPELADRIGNVYARAKGPRAITIARTETNGAASLGSVTGWKQSGVVKNKRWLSAIDERTRTPPDSDFDHVGADGEEVALDGLFSRTGESLRYPGDYSGSAGNIINCRCTMAPVTKSQA